MNSFRVKIALLAGLISAGALLGAGWFLWRQTAQWNLDRIDHGLREIGANNLQRAHGRSHFQRLDANLNSLAGTNGPPTYALQLWANDEQRRIIYVSEPWVEDWHPNSFQELGDPVVPVDRPDGQRTGGGKRPGGARQNGGPRLRLKAPYFETRMTAGEPWRIAVMGNRYDTMALAVRISDLESDAARLRNAYIVALGLALLAVSAGGWWLGGHALRPVTTLTRTAEQVTAAGLDRRIEAPTQDREFNRLITVFNEMMDRLEQSFEQAVRFSADASHELKTPLTIMQGELERAVAAAPAESEQQRVYVELLEEIQRLKSIVQKLLLLSRADAGQLRLSAASVDLSEMVEELCEDAGALSPGLKIETRIQPAVKVEADADLLTHVLRNLLSNAAKYNVENGWIRVELTRAGECVEIRVSNSGPGIQGEDRQRIFERFHRVQTSKAAKVDGVGLGLGLAREIARAHGGELCLEEGAADFVAFKVSLPAGNRDQGTPAECALE